MVLIFLLNFQYKDLLSLWLPLFERTQRKTKEERETYRESISRKEIKDRIQTIKQRRSRAITLQGAIEKSKKLHGIVKKNRQNYYYTYLVHTNNNIFIDCMYVQSAKILLLPPKCEIIFLPFKNGNFSNILIAILDFSPLLLIQLLLFQLSDSKSCRS